MFVHQYNAQCALKGTYTLGGGGADYANFTDLAIDLNTCGVDSHVVVNVNPGVYGERLILNHVAGTSDTSQIIINGGEASLATIIYDTLSTVYIDGTDWVTIKNMTVKCRGHDKSIGVFMRDSAAHNTIDSCIIQMEVSDTVSGVYGIVASDDESSTNAFSKAAYYTTISNCFIKGGNQGIKFTGHTIFYNVGNSILNNVIDSIDGHGIGVYYQDSLKIIGNTITNSMGFFPRAIWIRDVNGFEVSYNTVLEHDGKCLEVTDGNYEGVVTMRNKIFNNMMSSTSNTVKLDDIEETDIWHNTFYNHDAGGNPAFYINDMKKVDIRNNIFMSEVDYAFESLDNTDQNNTNNTIEFNAYWTTDTKFVRDGNKTPVDMATWQSDRPTMNMNSVEANPEFYSATDLHVLSALVDNLGDNTVGILDDIDGDVRSISTPDMGADEFTAPLDDDAAFVSFLTPATSIDCGGQEDVEVIIENPGLNTITSMIIKVEATGGIVQSLAINYTGSLLFGEKDTVVVGSINLVPGSNFDLVGIVVLPGDQDLDSDTSQSLSVAVNDAVFGAFTSVNNAGTVTFTDASTGNPVAWSWDFGDGNTSTDQNPVHTFTTGGTQNVTLTVTNECGVSSTANETIIITGVESYNNVNALIVFPNPSEGQFNLDLTNLKADDMQVAVIDQLGKVVFSENLNIEQQNNYSINLKDSSKGIYFLKLSSSKGVITKKLILN